MAEKLRPFRWRGEHGPAEDRKGALHIRWRDGETVRVIHPGETVKLRENLEALGAKRIAEFVAKGYADYLDVLERLGVDEILKSERVTSTASDDEKVEAQAAAEDATQNRVALEGLARTRKKEGRADDARITGASLGEAGPTVVVPVEQVTDPEDANASEEGQDADTDQDDPLAEDSNLFDGASAK